MNYQRLFNILHDLGITATEDDMREIIDAVDECRGEIRPPEYEIRELIEQHWPILIDVIKERRRQNVKFGENRNLHPFAWNAILGEEYGEVSKGALQWFYDGKDLGNYRKELEEVAAVAIAAILDLTQHGEPKR